MDSVFVLQHLHRLGDGEEDVKLIGVYRSRELALAAAASLALQPGFREFPAVREGAEDSIEGFYISAYTLDVDHWTEGFVTL